MRLTQQNLGQLDSVIGSLHEADLFKVCAKTMQDTQVQLLLPGNQLPFGSEELLVACFKQYQKAWLAYTKYLKHQVITKKMAVQCQVFGLFSDLANFGRPEEGTLGFIPA
jgi:hypothetical protein